MHGPPRFLVQTEDGALHAYYRKDILRIDCYRPARSSRLIRRWICQPKSTEHEHSKNHLRLNGDNRRHHHPLRDIPANLHYNLARREPYIDLNRNAQHIATVTKDKRQEDRSWHNYELGQRYLEMAQPFATSEAPAFAFTDCVFCHGTDPQCHCMKVPKQREN